MITNGHKLSGLRQYQCILLQFWRSEYEMGFKELKALAGLLPSGGPRGKVCSLTLPASRGFWHTLAHGCVTPSFAFIISLPSPLSDLLCPSKDPCGCAEPIHITWDNLPKSKPLPLSTPAKSILPCQVTYSQDLRNRTQISSGTMILHA